MKAVVLKCRPGSRFHFGKYALDTTSDADRLQNTALNDSDEIMHSDTLFSALVNNYEDAFDNADELANAFRDGLIKVSSVNYCINQGNDYVWFLPKPVSFNLFETENIKPFRRISYISKKVWENINDPLDIVKLPAIVTIAGKFVLYEDELHFPDCFDEEQKAAIIENLGIVEIITLPKVQVRKETQEGSLYQLSMTEIQDNKDPEGRYDVGVHMYFLMDIKPGIDEALHQKINTVIDLLKDTGIGGERSTIGKIEEVVRGYDWGLNMPPEDVDNETEATLSLVCPAPGEMEKICLAKHILRGGRRIGNNDKALNTVRMLVEGALVKKSMKGDVATITAGKGIYLRYGKALSLPIKSNWIWNYE